MLDSQWTRHQGVFDCQERNKLDGNRLDQTGDGPIRLNLTPPSPCCYWNNLSLDLSRLGIDQQTINSVPLCDIFSYLISFNGGGRRKSKEIGMKQKTIGIDQLVFKGLAVSKSTELSILPTSRSVSLSLISLGQFNNVVSQLWVIYFN